MIYNLANEYDLEDFKAKCDELVKAGAYVEIKRRHLARSLSQNAYLHVLIGMFALEFGYTADEVKIDIFKRRCNADIFEVDKENRRGKKVRCLRSSASLSTAEMTTAIERFRNYSASVANYYLPEPNEHRALMFAQQQIEKHKRWL